MTGKTTFTVWVRTQTGDILQIEEATEAVEFPDRIEIEHEYRQPTCGEIVRVRQTEVEHGAHEGYDLLLYPEGCVENVADALQLPTGIVKAADVTGEQYEIESRILWLKPRTQVVE